MTEPIVFEAMQNDTSSTFLILVLVAVTALFVFIFSFRQKKIIIAMLASFACSISAGSAIFTYLSQQKTTNVVIHNNAIKTNYGTCQLEKIKTIEVEARPISSLFKPPNEKASQDYVERFLVITEYSGKQHVLPANLYPIEGIRAALAKALQEQQQQQ